MKQGIFDSSIDELRQQYEVKLDRLRELESKLDKIKSAKYERHEELRDSVYEESKNLLQKVSNIQVIWNLIFNFILEKEP